MPRFSIYSSILSKRCWALPMASSSSIIFLIKSFFKTPLSFSLASSSEKFHFLKAQWRGWFMALTQYLTHYLHSLRYWIYLLHWLKALGIITKSELRRNRATTVRFIGLFYWSDLKSFKSLSKLFDLLCFFDLFSELFNEISVVPGTRGAFFSQQIE
jgi:hypothetical protein